MTREDERGSLSDYSIKQINYALIKSAHTPSEKACFSAYGRIARMFINLSTWNVKSFGRRGVSFKKIPLEIFTTLGKCAALFSQELIKKDVYLREFRLSDENTKENIAKVLHNIMLVDCIRSAIFNKYISAIQLFEFFKNGGFENLLILYQLTVDTIRNLKQSANVALKDLLMILLGRIINIYARLITPKNMIALSKSPITPKMEEELDKVEFFSIGNFLTTLLIFIIESVFIRVNYGEYKSAIKFLAECAQPSFKILMEVVKIYPINDTVEKMVESLGAGSIILEGLRIED